MSKQELRLAGSGGQGIILATVILAEVAVLAGKYTAQSQSYGPEARGGSCKAEVLISDEPILFTKVVTPTFVMALTQSSLEKYTKNLPESCRILADDSLTVPESAAPERITSLPILRTAKETVGKAQTANIVAVGVINRMLDLVPDEVMHEAVMRHVPRGTEALNEKALACGSELIGPSSDEKEETP